MQDLDLAYIVHRTPTRVRLRVPSRRNDAEFFASLARQIRAAEGITFAEGNASTASVVITSERNFDWARLRVSDFGLAVASTPGVAASAVGLRVSTTLAAACLPGQRGHAWGSQTDLSGLVVQLAPLMLARKPVAALLHWILEAVLKSLLRHLLTAQARSPQFAKMEA